MGGPNPEAAAPHGRCGRLGAESRLPLQIFGRGGPRPLLIEAGRDDRAFPIRASREAHGHLERIYAAAGAPEGLERDEFDGGHEFHAVASLEFMGRCLGMPAQS